jgi:hypothetical protein
MIYPRPEPTILQIVAAPAIAIAFIALCSLFKGPDRRHFGAIILAGAGAAYLSGGFGVWEFAFCLLMALVAFGALNDYRLLGAGWILHTVWDLLHHLYGNPIVPLVPGSSLGCAICDPVLAVWYFLGAPSIFFRLRRARTI